MFRGVLAWSRQRPALGRRLSSVNVRSSACGLVALVVAVVSIALRARAPIWADGSELDSLLYARQGASIGQGNWLGAFGEWTLSKGPAYPVYLALCHRAGISIQVGLQLTLLAAASSVAFCLWLLLRDVLLPTAAFILLALDPANFGQTGSYLGRDSWYASICLLALCSLFLTGYLVAYSRRIVPIVLSAALAGLSVATAALTREETAWLAPAGLILCGALPAWQGVRWFAQARSGGRRRLAWKRISSGAAAAAVIALCLLVPLQAVVMTNRQHYGVGLSNDLTAGNFPRAFADWTRVRAGAWLPRVPLSRQQRFAVYAVSPAARKLEPTMEDPANGYAALSCGRAAAGSNCEIPGAFMVWLTRASAARAGQFRSAAESQSYFGQLDSEINAACAAKTLSCARQLPPSLQPLQRTTFSDVASPSARSVRFMLTNPGFILLGPRNVSLTAEQRRVVRSVAPGFPASNAEAAAQAARFARESRPYRVLAAIYPPLLIGLLGVSLLGWLLAFFRRRVLDAAVVTFAAGMLVAVLTRAVFLGILDATEYPAAVNSRYQLPGRLCLIVFILVGLSICVRLVRTRKAIEPQPERATVCSDTDVEAVA